MNSERRKTFLVCSRCGIATVHTLQCSAESDVESWDADGYRIHKPATYNVFQCEGCLQVSMYIWSAFHRPDSEFGEQIYPQLLQEIEGVPVAVLQAYLQATQTRSHSNTAYAVLARKVLEAIAKDREIKERNLAHAMSVMSTRGDIPPLLAEAVALIRTFGNTAAHEIGADINEIHAQMIQKFLAILIDYLYTAPAALLEFKLLLGIETADSTPPNTSIESMACDIPSSSIMSNVKLPQ